MMIDRRTLIGLGGALLASGPARAADPAPLAAKILVAANRLWVSATIGGRGPFFFCIDTGTTISFIRPEIAQQLNLPAVGSAHVAGVGANRAYSGMVEVRDLLMGDRFSQPPTNFQVYDFGNQLPPQAAGLLSATILTGRDCELDFEQGEWRMWPDGRRDYAGLERLPSAITSTRPGFQPNQIRVTAQLDGKTYRLQVDTGAPMGLLLFGPAARRSGLFDDAHAFAPQLTGGFGGAAAKPSRIVRAGSFKLGPLSIERPLVAAMDPKQYNRFIDDGLIGLQYLSRLTIATDARRQILWARRNGIARPFDEYPLAGVSLDRAGDGGATISTVGIGSPAERAGLRTGDRIVDPPRFEEALQLTNGPAGKTIALRVQRGEEYLPVRYTLAAWL